MSADTISTSKLRYTDGSDVRLHISHSFTAADAAWQSLTLAHYTPYQHPSWVKAAAATIDQQEPLMVWLSDMHGTPFFMLPLCVERRKGLRLARFYGRDHLTYGLPLFSAEHISDDATFWQSLLEQVAKHAKVDVVLLEAMPPIYAGIANPLRNLPAIPGANPAFEADLIAPDGTPLACLSEQRTKDIQRRLRRLAQHGEVRFGPARTDTEKRRAYAAHRSHKDLSLGQRGIRNLFHDADVEAFFLALAADNAQTETFQCHLLTLDAGEDTVAMGGFVMNQYQTSGMILSGDRGEKWKNCAVGQSLLLKATDFYRDRGFHYFDLGLGDMAYKHYCCKRVLTVYDAHLGTTLRGKAYLMLMRMKTHAKRRIKANPYLWALIERLRKLRV